jgi:hypothetical protein
MAKQYYLPTNDEGKAALFEHFRDHIAEYAATLGLNGSSGSLHPDLVPQAADATYFRWLISQCGASRGYASSLTAWKDALRDDTELPNGSQPVAPAHTPPPAVPPGIVLRFQALVRAIKGHKNYTVAIGEALRIEGDEPVPLDRASARPDLTGAKVVGDRVRIPWVKGSFDGVCIEADRGDGKGWQFLAIDTRPDYADSEPFPAGGGVWKYRAIYLMDDQKVGQWSAVVSVRVG